MLSTMHLYPIDGAASRVKATRDAVGLSRREVGRGDRRRRSQSREQGRTHRLGASYWEALHPYSAGGAYVNFMMDEGEDRVKATYGKNYERLTKVKERYDKANLFRVNQNIRPAATPV